MNQETRVVATSFMGATLYQVQIKTQVGRNTDQSKVYEFKHYKSFDCLLKAKDCAKRLSVGVKNTGLIITFKDGKEV